MKNATVTSSSSILEPTAHVNLGNATAGPGVASIEVAETYFTLLLIGGQIALPLLVATFLFSKRIARHATLVNFLFTWVVSSFGGCFLFYAGQSTGPQPSHAACLTQVSFTYGAPILTAAAGVALVTKFLYDFRTIKFSRSTEQFMFFTLLVAPYLIASVFGIMAIVDGVRTPVGLTRTFLLCELSSKANTFQLPTTITLLILLFGIVLGEVLIGIKIFSFRQRSRTRNLDGSMVTGVPFSFYIRMGVFTLFSFLSVPTALTWTTNFENSFSYILQATIPLACFFVFGTQVDVLRIWLFWRRTDDGPTSYAFWRRNHTRSSTSPSTTTSISASDTATLADTSNVSYNTSKGKSINAEGTTASESESEVTFPYPSGTDQEEMRLPVHTPNMA